MEHETNQGATPLLCACHGGRADVVRFLLDSGADPDKTTWDKTTDPPAEWYRPLVHACYKGHTKVVEVLLSAVVSREPMEHAIGIAEKEKHPECARVVRCRTWLMRGVAQKRQVGLAATTPSQEREREISLSLRPNAGAGLHAFIHTKEGIKRSPPSG